MNYTYGRTLHRHELQTRYWRMLSKDGKAVLQKISSKGAVHQVTIFDERDESRTVAKVCPNGAIKSCLS